ncbi:cupin-like domain-containing protein [Burkholderia gladioli]|uniref:cupin-like domain-containing protein n=2 Tax=Burkholderia gladioli TaxID=28095 RepID=UPI001C221B35|nr:cupin-like domain-containing protein [Burkholderia gladioli]MBU9682176.1 cupin-like domain-containing protein [Burkholderia gladioli]
MMIARVTRAEFNEGGFLEQGRPVIITDALHDWRIAERWTPEYLANVAGERRVTLSTASDGYYRLKPSQDIRRSNTFENAEVDFGTAARRMLEADADDHVYVMQQSIPQLLPELLDNLVVPEWIAANRPMINLWFGRRTSSQLHFDYSNNLFAQLHGSKEFALFAPDETPRLYPYHHDAATAHLSNVEPDRPDLAAYPDYARAEAMRFTIHAGELLFMPVFWWHHVRAPGVSVSVNFWWYPTLGQILGASNATRALPGFYAGDRLEEFRQGFLAPAGLDFVAAGARFLEHGRTWGAALFAIAALDDWGRRHLAAQGVERAPGSRLALLAEELRPVRAALLADAALSAAHRSAIEDSAALAALIALSHDDAQVERARVEALLDALRACEARSPVPAS